MTHCFEGETANEVWLQAFTALTEGHSAVRQPGRGGTTRELSQVAFTITNPCQRWVIARQPAMNPAFAIADVIWMLNGRSESAFVNFWNRQLPKFAGDGE